MKSLRAIIISIISILFFTTSITAQTTLAAGDICIIGYNYDASPQELAIVTLVPINSGTTIFIADYGYQSGAFVANTLANNTEGSIEWLTTGNIAAGTVLRVRMASTNAGTTVTGLPGTLTIRGWAQVFGPNVVNGTNTPSPAGGETWFIYQGTDYSTPTQFVFGWANWATAAFGSANGWVVSPQSVGTNTQVSQLPAQLTNGTNARSLAWPVANSGMHGDNSVYTGTRVGTKAALLAAICNLSNWISNEDNTYDIAPGGTRFPGADPQFTVQASLPVVWGPVQATPLHQQVAISWITYDETNNNYFTIQHSSNGDEWSNIQQLPARGNEATGSTYVFTHTSPVTGVNYYRIRQTDKDGQFGYSKTVKATIEGQDELRLFPNPGKGTLILERKDGAKAQVNVLDLSGKIVHRQIISGIRVKLQTQLLPAGHYLVRIVSGQKITHLPFQIQQ